MTLPRPRLLALNWIPSWAIEFDARLMVAGLVEVPSTSNSPSTYNRTLSANEIVAPASMTNVSPAATV